MCNTTTTDGRVPYVEVGSFCGDCRPNTVSNEICSWSKEFSDIRRKSFKKIRSLSLKCKFGFRSGERIFLEFGSVESAEGSDGILIAAVPMDIFQRCFLLKQF